MVTVTDREGDIYDLFALKRESNSELLIRAKHNVLKSGCRIEQLQLKTAERIKKALATYTIVAWRYAERFRQAG